MASAVREHRRSVVIDEHGIATVTVKLEDCNSSEALVLATVSPPYSDVRFDEFAKNALGHRIDVEVEEVRSGTWVAAIRPGSFLGSQTLTWQFRASNAYPFICRDLVVAPGGFYQSGLEEHAGRSCVLHIPSERLTQTVRFDPPDAEIVRSATPFVFEEKRRTRWHGVGADWQRVAEGDTTRSAVDGEFSATHTKPRVGNRYAIGFRLAELRSASAFGAAEEAWNEALPLVRNLRDLGTTLDDHANALRGKLTDWLHRELREQCGEPDSKCRHWTSKGFVWDPTSKLLRAAFGMFPPNDWGQSFQYGEGVVGHAFRFGCEASYHKDHNKSLICKRDEPQWIVCLPLRHYTSERATGTCIGVVSLAGTDRPDDAVGSQLFEISQAVATQPKHGPECDCMHCRHARVLGSLTWRVNCAFWSALAVDEFLTPDHREAAAKCLDYWQRRAVVQPANSHHVGGSQQPSAAQEPRATGAESLGRRLLAPEVIAAIVGGLFTIAGLIIGPYLTTKPTETHINPAKTTQPLADGAKAALVVLAKASRAPLRERDAWVAVDVEVQINDEHEAVSERLELKRELYVERKCATGSCQLELVPCGEPDAWSAQPVSAEAPACDVRTPSH